MKNMKKALCFVLAMVFVLGLCTVGAGAATNFSDSAKVKYTDAVNITANLGIIKGDDNDGDGKMEFRPKDTITRAEAAVIIARMILGDNYEKLPKAGTSFTDVGPGMSEWAQSAIAFCEARGIVNGRGDGKFYPQDNVTGLEMAKMLLCANGYGGDGKFTGKGWNINVFTEATTNKVFKSVADSVDFEAPATREECALYTLNTLQNVKQLTVDSKGNVVESSTMGEQVWNMKSVTGQLMETEATGADYSVLEYETTDDKGVTKIEKLLFKFDYEAAGIDSLGKIAHEITVFYNDEKDEKEGYYEAYNLEDNSTTVANLFGTFNDTYNALVAANRNNGSKALKDVQVWQNYAYQDHSADTTYVSYFDTTALGWLGDVLQISDYKGRDNGMFYSNLFYDSGTYVLNGEGELIARMTTSFISGKVNTVKSDEIIIDQLSSGALVKTTYAKTNTTAYDGIAKDDVVIIQPIGAAFYQILPTTTRVAKVTSLSSSTINGSLYQSQQYYKGLAGNMAAAVQLGVEYTFYLDPNGSYLDAVPVSDEVAGDFIFLQNNFHVASNATVASQGKSTPTFYVRGVTGNGDVVSYKINADYAKDLNGDGDTITTDKLTAGADGAVTGGWARGVWKITLNGNDEVVKLDGPEQTYTKKANKVSYLENGTGDMYYITSDTKVFYLRNSKNNFSVSAGSLVASAADVTGIYGYAEKGASGYLFTTIFVDTAPATASKDEVGSYMFIGASSSGGVPSAGGSELVGDKAYDYYTVYIDGVKDSKAFITNPATITAPNAFYTYSKDSSGLYTITPLVTDATLNVEVVMNLKAEDYNSVTGKYYYKADGADVTGMPLINLSSASTYDYKSTLKLDNLDDVVALISKVGYTRDYSMYPAEVYNAVKGSVTLRYLVTVDSNGIETPFGAFYLTAATDVMPAEDLPAGATINP